VSIDPQRFPLLVGWHEVNWGSTLMRYRFDLEAPEPAMIGNVRCAAFVGDRVVLIDTDEFGLSGFPGGTLEPDEAWHDALERELLEETGTRPLSVDVIGRIHFRSGADEPYRPHLPFPEFQQVVTVAEVDIVGTPTNPSGGEHVRSVELVPAAQAIERLSPVYPFEAQLLALVLELRSSPPLLE
jgi:8-oxo-dGTP diphosphatase